MTRLIPFGATSTMRLSGAVNGIVEKATWMSQENSKRLVIKWVITKICPMYK